MIYANTYPRSKAGTISIAEGLRLQLMTLTLGLIPADGQTGQNDVWQVILVENT